MSEQLNPAAANLSQPLTGNALHNASQMLAEGEPVCAAEDIGVATIMDDGTRVEVMGIVSIPGEQSADDLAVVSFVGPSGNRFHGLTSLNRTEEGGFRSTNLWQPLPPSGRLTIGREDNPAEGVIGRTGLWPHAVEDKTISRKHVGFEVTADGVEVIDTSANGSFLAAGEKVEQAAAAELQITEREHQLYAPAKNEHEEKSDQYWQDLVAGRIVNTSVQAAAVPEASMRATVANEARAKHMVETLNQSTKQAVAEYLKATGQQVDSAEQMVGLIRTDEGLRVTIARSVQELIAANLDKMPPRIVSNTGQNPTATGYENLNLRSREYVCMLALSYLDGTFDSLKTDYASSADYDHARKSGVGQHRYAVEAIL